MTAGLHNDAPHRRVRAEWEPYDTVMMAWPGEHTDWAPMLRQADECYMAMARAIAASGLRLLVVDPDGEAARKLSGIFPAGHLIAVSCRHNDTWTRDYGPVTVEETDGSLKALDFRFDGWGLKFAANFDNLVNLQMVEKSLLRRDCYEGYLDYTFEGGSLETDGNGTMLSTAECLQALNRNGYRTEEQLREYFAQTLGITHFHLLHHGALDGDDTDSHIDTLARFAPHDTILYVKSYNPADSHTRELDLMEEELKALRTAQGNPYNLIALPLPDAIYDPADGSRLPATYANFLITPRTVLMPVYAQPANDRMAHQMLQIAFPDREIIDVDCRALIRQHGSLHCSTMQIPQGLLTI